MIEMIDCDEAIDRVMVGPERKSVVMSQKEKEIDGLPRVRSCDHRRVARESPIRSTR